MLGHEDANDAAIRLGKRIAARDRGEDGRRTHLASRLLAGCVVGEVASAQIRAGPCDPGRTRRERVAII